jgi:hypothetical protein
MASTVTLTKAILLGAAAELPRVTTDQIESASAVTSSAAESGLRPAFEDPDPLPWPCSVAWHSSGLHALEDRLGVRADVVVGPEVECELHRLAVALSEQWLDVLLEADRLACCRELDRGRRFAFLGFERSDA